MSLEREREETLDGKTEKMFFGEKKIFCLVHNDPRCAQPKKRFGLGTTYKQQARPFFACTFPLSFFKHDLHLWIYSFPKGSLVHFLPGQFHLLLLCFLVRPFFLVDDDSHHHKNIMLLCYAADSWGSEREKKYAYKRTCCVHDFFYFFWMNDGFLRMMISVRYGRGPAKARKVCPSIYLFKWR